MAHYTTPQGTQSKNFSSSKISKISLVDLAGLDKHKPEGVGERTEDGRDVKQSLAKLGYDFLGLHHLEA